LPLSHCTSSGLTIKVLKMHSKTVQHDMDQCLRHVAQQSGFANVQDGI